MMMVAVPVVPSTTPVMFSVHAPSLQQYQAQCIQQQQQQWQVAMQQQWGVFTAMNGSVPNHFVHGAGGARAAEDRVADSLEFAYMCQIVSDIFSAIALKDPILVKATLQKVLAPEAVLTWASVGSELAGRDKITEHVVRSLQTVPDLEFVQEDIVMEGKRSVRISQRVVGTAAQANPLLPYFQVGTNSCKTVSTVVIFDELGRIKERQATLVLPISLSSEPSMIKFIVNHTLELSATPAGSRLLQDALEILGMEDQIALAAHFHSRVVEASSSPSGNFILQRLIERLPGQRSQFIASELLGCAVTAAQHRTQNRVIERLIEHCPCEHTEALIDEVISSGVALSTNSYGNFVVQSVLVHGTEHQRCCLTQLILNDAYRLAKHKFGSNVVRTALVHAPPEQKHMLIEAFTADSRVLSKLSQHKVGSFVARDAKAARKHMCS